MGPRLRHNVLMKYELEPIAYMRSEFPEKFGIPRQSGLVEGLPSRIVFLPQYAPKEAFRGLEEYSHVWILWVCSENADAEFKATVRPPRLGGNERVGVYASRSPYHPNHIGLSLVKLLSVECDAPGGPALIVDGADLMDGTPVLDVKPYLAYTEAVPDAAGGFADRVKGDSAEVEIPGELLLKLPEALRKPLLEILSQNPKPAYKNDPERIYGMSFSDYNVSFKQDGKLIRVTGIERIKQPE